MLRRQEPVHGLPGSIDTAGLDEQAGDRFPSDSVAPLRGSQVAVALAYQRGSDMQTLTREYRVHRTTVSHCLHDLGVPLRRQGLRQEDMPETARLYAEGWSLARLGEKYGCGHTAVRKALLDHDVQLRLRRGWIY